LKIRVGGYKAMTFREFANSSNETNNKPAKEQRDKPKLLDQVRITLRANHYSTKTEEAYLNWIKRFILFNNKDIRVKWVLRFTLTWCTNSKELKAHWIVFC